LIEMFDVSSLGLIRASGQSLQWKTLSRSPSNRTAPRREHHRRSYLLPSMISVARPELMALRFLKVGRSPGLPAHAPARNLEENSIATLSD
jgi:hypothetical protein